ncbi:hypothetical protein L218DRAFT_1043051 [Marasmius fiardii PR-910]|nr:hypothetical protein L218DRAFT_1043051 [Marasmius fiardii PR-910]
MIIDTVKSLVTRQLLRFPLKPTTQLGRTKPSHLKPTTAKLAIKPGPVHCRGSPTKQPRRKRSNPPGHSTKQYVLNPQPQFNSRAALNAKVLKSFSSFEPVFDVSVTDFYVAAQRAISQLGACGNVVSLEDVAMIEKLRKASFKHEIMTSLKAIQKRLESGKPAEANARRAEVHQVIAKQLGDEDEKRARLVARKEQEEKVAVKIKGQLFGLAAAARRGERLDTVLSPPSRDDVLAWARYDAKWKQILSGNVDGSISALQNVPLPTLKRGDMLEKLEYEEFVLMPTRPGYEKVFLPERLAKERELWDEAHVAKKLLPLCEQGIRDKVVQLADCLRYYLEDLAEKYGVGECDGSERSYAT